MTASRIPTGPIEIAPYNAITPPRAPRGAAATETFRAELLAALDGIQLGAYDHRMIAWLAGWDTETVATVCSWLVRTRAAAAAESRTGMLGPTAVTDYEAMLKATGQLGGETR